MRSKIFLGGAAVIAAFLGSMVAFQRPFREYPGIEYNDFALPPDWRQNAEWAFARLMYPPYTGRRDLGFGGFYRYRGDWTHAIPSGPRTTRAPIATFCLRSGA